MRMNVLILQRLSLQSKERSFSMPKLTDLALRAAFGKESFILFVGSKLVICTFALCQCKTLADAKLIAFAFAGWLLANLIWYGLPWLVKVKRSRLALSV